MDPSKFSDSIKPICSAILDLPPSCIEFAPGFPEWFVVGTYNLQKDVDTGSAPQSRTGSLNLFRIVEDELTLVQTLSHPSAILDLHFLPNDSGVFAVSSSTGTVSIYNFEPGLITHLITQQVFESSLLILSFTWFPSNSPLFHPVMAVTLSNGSLHLLQFFNSDFDLFVVLKKADPLNTHELEAWTCAFSVPNARARAIRIYSGGDDRKLRLVELESLPTTAEDVKITIVQTIPQTVFKGHEAGVTAILPLPVPNGSGASKCSNGLGDLLLTGSYDDFVRVYTTYDTRPDHNTSGKALAELKIGGGVWRLKFLDDPPVSQKEGGSDGERDVKFRVLASCMHAGARILEVRRDPAGNWSIEILGSVTVHESMCYGSDVQPGGETDGGRLCVSTSFYDRLVCVWRFEPKSV